MHPRRHLLMGICLIGLLPLNTHADIFAFRDENGVMHITNVKSHDKRYQLIRKESKPGEADRPSVIYRSNKPGKSLRTLRANPEMEALVSRLTHQYSVDRALVKAVIHAESSYNPRAVSPKGAQGLMQLMPATAARYGVRDAFDPAQNISGGVRYLRDLLTQFNQNTRLAVAAYNAGENSVLRYGGIPPYRETKNYVAKVLQLHKQYKGQTS